MLASYSTIKCILLCSSGNCRNLFPLRFKPFNLIFSLLGDNCCSEAIGPAEVEADFSAIKEPRKPSALARSGLTDPPFLTLFLTLGKQNTARHSHRVLPVAITSMGASALRTVWCWVPPIGTGYQVPLPTMSVECKCLFKKLCSSIDFI